MGISFADGIREMEQPMSYQAARQAEKLLAHNKEVVVATITATEGSSPRHVGSFMVFSRSGGQWGTVGGSKVEAVTIEEARRAFETRKPCYEFHYDMHVSGDHPQGMACGGACDVRIEYFNGKDGRTPVMELPEPARAFLFGAEHVNTALVFQNKIVLFYNIYNQCEKYNCCIFIVAEQKFVESLEVTMHKIEYLLTHHVFCCILIIY